MYLVAGLSQNSHSVPSGTFHSAQYGYYSVTLDFYPRWTGVTSYGQWQ
ncbi:hypothetical protein DIKCMJMK_04267 [Shewanella oneidensis]|nr:hypothetical protein [Shewanella oneidensis]